MFFTVKDNEYINAVSIEKSNQDVIEGGNSTEAVTSVDFTELLTQINSNLILYEERKDIVFLKNAIEIFGSIPKSSKIIDNDIIKNSKELNEYFNKIKSYCYNLESKSNQEAYVKMFAENIFLGWKYNKNIIYFKDYYLIESLVRYNVNLLPNIQDRLNYLEYVTKYYDMYGDPYPEHEVIPSIDLPEENLPDTDDSNNNQNNSNNNGNSNNNSNNNNNNNNTGNNTNIDTNINSKPNSSYTSIIKFKRHGNKCYKVEEFYKDGIKTSTNESLASKSDYTQCSIYDYVNFGSGTLLPNIEIDKNHLYNNQNVDSEYFAYYTITKGNKTPYYYNTGIRASATGDSLSYSQLNDLLYQLSIKTDNFSIKSNKESLFIIEGKPIVLNKNTNPNYTKTYVENMLNEYSNLGIKIMKNSQYSTSLNEYNEEHGNRNYINYITIDDSEASEFNIAWIDGSGIIKTDIKIISELLGAKTKIEQDKLIITKDSIEIVLENNKTEYLINGKSSSFLEKTYKDKNSLISELADIPQKLGYDVDFDMDENKLEFSKIN